jgi:hypothetical protein
LIEVAILIGSDIMIVYLFVFYQHDATQKGTTTKMDLQMLFTLPGLPGYSWRRTGHLGNKSGVDGIYLELITYD